MRMPPFAWPFSLILISEQGRFETTITVIQPLKSENWNGRDISKRRTPTKTDNQGNVERFQRSVGCKGLLWCDTIALGSRQWTCSACGGFAEKRCQPFMHTCCLPTFTHLVLEGWCGKMWQNVANGLENGFNLTVLSCFWLFSCPGLGQEPPRMLWMCPTPRRCTMLHGLVTMQWQKFYSMLTLRSMQWMQEVSALGSSFKWGSRCLTNIDHMI